MNDPQSSSFLHVILLLVLALTNYLLVMHRRSLTERIDALEKLLAEFLSAIDDQTPKD